MIRSSGSDVRLHASDYLLYRRCRRSLHLRLRGDDLPVESPSDALYPMESERRRVIELARRRYPSGVIADEHAAAWPTSTADEDDALTLFDARCTFGPFEAVADVRRPQKPSGSAIEIICEASSIKESYLYEAAFVDYCFAGCGARAQRVYITHVNKAYEREDVLDPERLFVRHDVTRRMRRIADQVREELEQLSRELDADPFLERYADIPCGRSRTCPVCSRDLPERAADHVVHLHRGGALVDELLEEGITSITEIPRDRLAHPRQEIQQETIRSGVPHVDTSALRAFLERLVAPIAYLDFEATSTALPPHRGTHPWEHIPYLYSLHIEAADGALRHTSYLVEPDTDGREELARHLVDDAKGCGCVVVYSAGFERSILKRLGDAAPSLADQLDEFAERIVDLLDPFSNFSFHHHEQRGKVSLKSVLPVLTDHDYSGEEIRDGYTANLVYRYLAQTDAVDADQRAALLAHLVSYCTMDTIAMVHIVRELRELAHA